MQSKIIRGIIVLSLVIAAFFTGKLSRERTTPAAQPKNQQGPRITMETVRALFSADAIVLGDPKAKLLLVEVADTSCPYCQIAAGKNPSLNAQYPQFKLVSQGGTYDPPVEEFKKLVDAGKAAFVWMYYPGHGNGQMGAKALYCANEKGKFWEAHDLLMSEKGYEMQNSTVENDKTKSGILAAFLTPAVDPSFLTACLDSGKYDAQLTKDTQRAADLGVGGTPGFFINTTSFPGAYNFTDMKSAVDAAL